MTAACDNCQHPAAAHTETGCEHGKHSVDPCGCPYEYHRDRPAFAEKQHLMGERGSELERCGDRFSDPIFTSGKPVSCYLRKGHDGGFHRSAEARWAPDAPGRIVDSPDPVGHQVGGSHYTDMPIQPWDIIDAFGLGFYEGSALKYLLRAGRKGSRLEDLQKCRHYLDKLIEVEEGGG